MDAINSVGLFDGNQYLVANNTTVTNNFDDVFKNVSDSADTSDLSLEDIFTIASDKYNIDYDFLTAVGYTESGYDINSTSSSGAMGVMQLMPETAVELGVSNPYDPYDNILGGAKLLSSLLEKYNGNRTLALAAYNAGSGAVRRYGGVPPYKETVNYIHKIDKLLDGALAEDSWTLDGAEPIDYTELKDVKDSSTASGNALLSSNSSQKALVSGGNGQMGVKTGIAGEGYNNNPVYLDQITNSNNIFTSDNSFVKNDYSKYIDIVLNSLAEKDTDDNVDLSDPQTVYEILAQAASSAYARIKE